MAINPANLKLSHLRMLAAVAEHGNFGKAGLSLDMTQSSISHGIAALEEELGVVLLSRGRYGARLTPVGEQILAYAQQMLSLSEAIAQTANSARGLEGGTVQIASFRSFATHVLPPVLAELRQQYPGISISISELSLQHDVERAVLDGVADVGILHLPVGEEFDVGELLRDEYLVLVPPDVSVSAAGLQWEDFRNQPIILPPKNDSCSDIVRHHFDQHQQVLDVAYEIKESSTAVSMVAQGLGIAILARLVAEPIPPSVQVFRLPVPLERRAGYAIRTDGLHTPAVYTFLDVLRRSTQQTQPKRAIAS